MNPTQDDAKRKLNHLADKYQTLFDGQIITPIEQAVARLTENCARLQARLQVVENDIVSLDDKIKRLYRELEQHKNGK